MCPHIVPTKNIVDTEVPTAAVYLALRRNPPSWPAGVTAFGTDSQEDTEQENEEDERTGETSRDSPESRPDEPEEWEKDSDVETFYGLQQSAGLGVEGVWYS